MANAILNRDQPVRLQAQIAQPDEQGRQVEQAKFVRDLELAVAVMRRDRATD
ncbi:hypothetical protein [Parasphingorhabdus sp.]|uniref:hypothetical protein n=1 Tax=Parasphingorhabdus sp. TaxID=2709688 RepID=UPI0032EE078C